MERGRVFCHWFIGKGFKSISILAFYQYLLFLSSKILWRKSALHKCIRILSPLSEKKKPTKEILEWMDWPNKSIIIYSLWFYSYCLHERNNPISPRAKITQFLWEIRFMGEQQSTEEAFACFTLMSWVRILLLERPRPKKIELTSQV